MQEFVENLKPTRGRQHSMSSIFSTNEENNMFGTIFRAVSSLAVGSAEVVGAVVGVACDVTKLGASAACSVVKVGDAVVRPTVKAAGSVVRETVSLVVKK